MASAYIPYYDCIRRTLHAALCIGNYPSRVVERHNKPEVEVAGCSDGLEEEKVPELILNPIKILRSENESCLIETTINSVRISFSFTKSDALAELIARKYVGFLAQRAQQFRVLRKKAIPGYDISFLITHDEMETMYRSKIIDFIITFLVDIDSDIAAMKLNMNQRGRRAAAEFFQSLNFP
ncbi:putative ARP2 3 complex 20 kDa subunit (ARPC4) [Trypanosoma vivax]|uniref:Actin-related protein 2/3 complex subunit 4 n=1 Tax=Trypanosoma vivax (strain Y486) TaxID=1055687 RepID=G0TRS4_TRYVY|nr:putative ARP2/3 complex subunit [Trypanosoma vivax]KAH8607481.1 putative ARP2 3 complex 20 kDa subunit (ARPC4) [Trypanosoma vivax]CCC46646.1 putative ARP2/3 complex subunit [Trypanosoma vivax Y486]